MKIEELLSKLDSKMDKVIEDVTEIRIVQAKQAVIQEKHEENLKEHMQASKSLKDLYDHLKEKEIEPLKSQVHEIKGGYKALKVIGAILIALAGLAIKFFSH